MNLRFTVKYFAINDKDKCPIVDIATDRIDELNSFDYMNCLGMYKTKSTQGHGIQVNDKALEKPLLKMCDKISKAIYDFQKEIKEIK